MVLHNPNNWHWVNKDASSWAKQWFEENVVGTKVEDGGVSAEVAKVTSMEGDVDVNQRKGKVITIFDVKLVLEYTGKHSTADRSIAHVLIEFPGKTADDEEVNGNITVPEVAHDTEQEEYVVCDPLIPINITNALSSISIYSLKQAPNNLLRT